MRISALPVTFRIKSALDGRERTVRSTPQVSLNGLQKEIFNAMPYARRYGRALTGNAAFADPMLAKATANVLKHAPSSRFLLPHKMILPWLLLEFHKQLDSNSNTRVSVTESTCSPISDPVSVADTSPAEALREDLLYEKFDIVLRALPEVQRRIFLLTTLEQFRPIVIARILSIPRSQVQTQFHQANLIVIKELVAANPIAEAA